MNREPIRETLKHSTTKQYQDLYRTIIVLLFRFVMRP